MLVILIDSSPLVYAEDEGRGSTNGFLSEVNYLYCYSPFIFSANAKKGLIPVFRLRDQNNTSPNITS